MALIVNLKSAEYLPGKYDRIARLTFRGHSYESNVVYSAKRVAYFGQTFEWPVARNLEPHETIIIELFNYSKYFNRKLVGSYTLVAQHLVHNGYIAVSDPLADVQNRMLEATINFDVQYYSADGKIGNWANTGDLLTQVNADTVIDIDETESHNGNDALILLSDKGLDSGGLPGEDTASQNVLLEKIFDGKKVNSEVLEVELHRPKDFEVRVTVIEAQQLAGLDIDPVIKISVADQARYTNIRQSTNCPYYNEYFVFDFNETAARVFDKIITISAYHAYGIPGRHMLKAGNVVAGSLIGHFKCDLGTIFAAPDHQFYHKWAVLIDPKDTTAGPKGYVKCDLIVCEHGATIRPPKGVKEADTNNIEGNLLLPAGVPSERQRALYSITIYRAEDLPRTDLGIFASMQKAITKKEVAFIDACVKVSFVGHIGKTSVIKSYNPEWKEVLLFSDMFPPLCNRIKVQLCDADITSDETIATHFIELAQIMDPGAGDTEGILPSFGPSWINLYGSPRQFKVTGNDDDLNEGIGEGAAFRGRLLVSIDTTIVEGEMAAKSMVKCEKLLRSSGVMDCFPRRSFLIFATVFEASMIDKQFESKPVYFELSIGKFGNNLDHKPGKTIFGDSDTDASDSDDDSAGQTLLQKQKKEEAETCISHSETDPQCVSPMDDRHYGFLRIDAEKPCLYSIALFEDFRKRLYHTNMLSRINESLNEGLTDVKEMVKDDDPLAYRRLKGAMEILLKDCENYLRLWKGLETGVGAGKTRLDRHRLKACRTYVEKLRVMATHIRRTTTQFNVSEKYCEAKDGARKLRHLIKDPQHALPDVMLWMICEKKRIAYYRFMAKDLLYASDEFTCGKDCGKRQTVFLKKPGKKAQGESGWTMQAKVELCLWLGEYDKTSQPQYLSLLPAGYEAQYEDADHTKPPIAVVYEDSYLFQLRAYMYQARGLIGCDDTGLSDPFARVIVCNQCKSTQVIKESLCPTWDETLIFSDILIHGVREDLLHSPPIVIVEFYDYDVVGQPEFLGRCCATPQVKLEDEANDPTTLEWFDIYRGQLQAGQLLASFELLEGDVPAVPETKALDRDNMPVFAIPPEIRPSLSKFHLEVLFRGVRQLKKIQFVTVTKPKIIVECNGKMISSSPIRNIQLNSNFDNPLQKIDVYLPDNQLFWPPLTIRCIECRTFGRQILVGVCTVDHIENYLPALSQQRQLENGVLPVTDDTLLPLQDCDIVGNISGETSNVPDVIQMSQSVEDKVNLVPAEQAPVAETPNDTVRPESVALSRSKTVPTLKEKSESQKAAEEKKARVQYRELISDCDWWSKYYASKDEVSEDDRDESGTGKRTVAEQDQMSVMDYGFDIVDYSNLDTSKLVELQNEAKKQAAEMEKNDKKKKKKKKKKSVKKKMSNLKGKINNAFQQDESSDNDSNCDNEETDDKGYISRFQVYSTELENIPEFKGFKENFDTFALFHGKKSMDDEEDELSRLSGYFKGKFCIYKVGVMDDDNSDVQTVVTDYPKDDETEEDLDNEKKINSKLKLSRGLPTHRSVEVKVFVYIVRALDLHPVDFNGKADPYLVITCGRKKIVDKENKICNQLNPVFGRMFEFDVSFPLDSWLDIDVYDYDALSSDDIIGSTTVDLENRFFSKHQARCGLQQRYELFGYNTWRNPLKPTEILDKLCKEVGFDAPSYQSRQVEVNKQQYTASDVVENEAGEVLQTREHLALEVLKNWHNFEAGCALVPEHVETRPLYCTERPGEQGKLEMWVDMFAKDSPMPTVTLDITPRKPVSYELRCIIWNTDEVTLDDVNPLTNEQSSDIFVKGYLKGVGEDDQATDVHYRSLTGEGNFNWRFVYQFEYLIAEEKIIFHKKESFLDMNEQEFKLPPNLTLQIWDADLISSDDFLGSITLDLNRIPKPAKNPKKCTLKMLGAIDKVPTLNLFKNKRCKGWWPVAAREKDEESGEEKQVLKGKIEAELHLLTSEEAEKNPVGMGRKEPEPLKDPDRPDTSFMWFLNPLKSLYYIIWKNYKWLIIKILIVLLLIAFIALLLYTMPGAISDRIVHL